MFIRMLLYHCFLLFSLQPVAGTQNITERPAGQTGNAEEYG
jgi:hypothetical protein